MTTIGTFTKQGDRYEGSIQTLSLKVPKVSIEPIESTNADAPDHKVLAANFEFGAAWTRESKAGRSYLSVKLDDPSLPAAIYARLMLSEGDNYILVWSRT